MEKIKIKFKYEFENGDASRGYLCIISNEFQLLWKQIDSGDAPLWCYVLDNILPEATLSLANDFRQQFYDYFSRHHDDCDMIDADDLYDMIEKFFINGVDVHYYMTHVHLGKVTHGK